MSIGNVDYIEWTLRSHLNFPHDTDKVMGGFYNFDHKAGSSNCGFYSSTPSAIRERLDSMFQNIRVHPAIVPAAKSTTELPKMVTYSSLNRLISATLYRPI